MHSLVKSLCIASILWTLTVQKASGFCVCLTQWLQRPPLEVACRRLTTLASVNPPATKQIEKRVVGSSASSEAARLRKATADLAMVISVRWRHDRSFISPRILISPAPQQARAERDVLLLRVRSLESKLVDLAQSPHAELVHASEVAFIGNTKLCIRNVQKSLGLLKRGVVTSEGGAAAYVAEGTSSSIRVLLGLLKRGELFDKVLPAAVTSPMLLSHSLSIYARAAELEPHVPFIVPILERHLPAIEPHLDEILEQV